MKKKVKELEDTLKDFIKIKKKYFDCFNEFLNHSEITLKNKKINKGKIDFSNLAIFNNSYDDLNSKYNVEGQISTRKIKSSIKQLKDLVNDI